MVIYFAILVFTILRILIDTHSSSKALAYILLVILVPLIGMVFYFWFGINYRHQKITRIRKQEQIDLSNHIRKAVPDKTDFLAEEYKLNDTQFKGLVKFIHEAQNTAMGLNKCLLLNNGEEKFPEVLRSLENAGKFIHMEYYAWENDINGNLIKEVLIRKQKQGVKVRIMYDAYASRKIKGNIVKELRSAGCEIYPIIKIKITLTANRLNYRDHRKIIIIDGHTGFIGGINISDRYDNSIDTKLFWRDTHMKITGQNVLSMQKHFVINWNVCQPNHLDYSEELFPSPDNTDQTFTDLVQIVAGGPIYRISGIMLSYFKLFTSARESLYIVNPYFIPNTSVLDALKQAAFSGVDVRMILPYKSDSAIVSWASKFYFRELLQAGVKIYQYRKGFVHAKTVVADRRVSVVGTANLDIRSFDLNFEIMALIYSESFANQMEEKFREDLLECTELDYEEWLRKPLYKKIIYSVARLVSNLL